MSEPLLQIQGKYTLNELKRKRVRQQKNGYYNTPVFKSLKTDRWTFYYCKNKKVIDQIDVKKEHRSLKELHNE